MDSKIGNYDRRKGDSSKSSRTTGLGLSISWDIVTQQHGGTIAVDSRLGEFTEFAIRLPRAHQVVAAAAAAG